MGYKVEYKCTEDNKLRITKKLENDSSNIKTDEVSFDINFTELSDGIKEAISKKTDEDIKIDNALISRNSANLLSVSKSIVSGLLYSFNGDNEAIKIKKQYEEKLKQLWNVLKEQQKITNQEEVDNTASAISQIKGKIKKCFDFLIESNINNSNAIKYINILKGNYEHAAKDLSKKIKYKLDKNIASKLKDIDSYLEYADKGESIVAEKINVDEGIFQYSSAEDDIRNSYDTSGSYSDSDIKILTSNFNKIKELKDDINKILDDEINNKYLKRYPKIITSEEIKNSVNQKIGKYDLEIDTGSNDTSVGYISIKNAVWSGSEKKGTTTDVAYKNYFFKIKSKSGEDGVSATDIIEKISRHSNKEFSEEVRKILENSIGSISSEVNKNLVINTTDGKKIGLKSIGDIVIWIENTVSNIYNSSELSDTSTAKSIEEYFDQHKQALISSLDAQGGFESFVEVDNYADYYTTMTPYVQLRFPTSESSDGEFSIDTVNYPFIKSLKMTDNGAKKFTIVLYDRDFNSVVYDKNNKPIGSLDLLLAGALGINQLNKKENDKIEEEDLETYNFDRAAEFGDIKGMKFNEGSSNIQKANLYIKYGYADVNPPIKGYVNETLKKAENEDRGYYYAGNTLYLYDNKETKNSRNARWWDTSTEIAPDTNKTIDVRSRSVNPTTSRNSTVKTLITGYKTRFTSAGVYYTIEAIEFTSERLSKYKVFQRYTNIVGTPKEVLYTVMNLLDGLFDDLSFYLDDSLFENVKHVTDEKDESGKKNKIETITGIYEEEEEQEQEDGTIKLVKKPIQISLGSKDAVSMYNAENSDDIAIKTLVIKKDVPKLYKSVASILNELCAAMPPRPESTGAAKDVYTQDQDGNTKKVIEQEEKYRKFTYSIVAIKDDKGRDTGKSAIYFYYQKPTKFEKIRKYTWGPGNSENTVIKDVDINTENEYALLSSMKSITADDNGSYTKQIKSRDGYSVDTKAEGKKALAADYIYQPYENKEASKIRMALSYSQCLYKGTITVLGDPFYTFDNYVKPFTYPIYIDFKIPRSEVQFYNDNYNVSTKSWGSKQKIGYSHFMSGFYVVTSIEHSITTDGFTTTLGVMSYPNLANDIV